MTIDDLAVALGREFQNIQGEFQRIHQKFEKIDEEFLTIHQRFIDVFLAIESIDVHLSAYASRFSEDLSQLQEQVGEHDDRLRFLEKQK